MSWIFLFIVVPLAELALLARIAGAVGWFPTVVLCVGTGALGATLTRSQGLATLRRAQGELAAGGLPALPLVEGALILAAGVVLLTPGVLTDAIGFLLLVPAVRRQLARRLSEHLRARVRFSGTRGAPARQPEERIIEAEFTDLGPATGRGSGPAGEAGDSEEGNR